jgi:hypothetical protein
MSRIFLNIDRAAPAARGAPRRPACVYPPPPRLCCGGETEIIRAWIVRLGVDVDWFPEAQLVIVLSLEVNNCSGSLPAKAKSRGLHWNHSKTTVEFSTANRII